MDHLSISCVKLGQRIGQLHKESNNYTITSDNHQIIWESESCLCNLYVYSAQRYDTYVPLVVHTKNKTSRSPWVFIRITAKILLIVHSLREPCNINDIVTHQLRTVPAPTRHTRLSRADSATVLKTHFSVFTFWKTSNHIYINKYIQSLMMNTNVISPSTF